ncbi:MAG TPA: ZIP family metal transporter [Candidatus Paceibacterota bacterium]|jgi:ZIP family zinc transporter|nr:ZIP family metal transporter [Candidatus Paceibacterota bacterium]
MTAILLSIATFFSTSFGGLFAIKFRDRLHTIMAFTAGVLLGVVSFDILPEIIAQVEQHSYATVEPMIALVAGFLVFHIVEKSILIHHEREEEYAEHRHPQVGVASALALTGHSFMDGVGIGLGFQVNAATGLLVALAVIAHDFTDGMNTVTLVLVNKNTPMRARLFLLLDAAAPVLGVLSTFAFHVSPHFLVWYLGFFAGFLLYIGASDILPEAHSKHSSYKLIGLTLVGVILIFIVTRFA